MVILADTTIWVDHFRNKNVHFSSLLNENIVALHPFVFGELVCGKIKNRREIISLLNECPGALVVESYELLNFIDQNSLAGSGVGFVDAHLLASSKMIGAMLWTTDKALQTAALKLDLSYT